MDVDLCERCFLAIDERRTRLPVYFYEEKEHDRLIILG